MSFVNWGVDPANAKVCALMCDNNICLFPLDTKSEINSDRKHYYQYRWSSLDYRLLLHHSNYFSSHKCINNLFRIMPEEDMFLWNYSPLSHSVVPIGERHHFTTMSTTIFETLYE